MTNKKRVLINASMYEGQLNGYGTYLVELTKHAQSNSQIDYDVISFHKLELIEANNLLIKYGFIQKLISFGVLSFYRVIWNLVILTFLGRKYDEVLCLTPHGSLFLKNQIVQVMDLIAFDYPYNKFQYYYYKLILSSLIKRAQKIFTLSEYSKEEIVKHFRVNPDKVNIVYCGVDHLEKEAVLQCPYEGLKKVEFNLIVGAGLPHKNALTVLKVYAKHKVSETLVIVTKENGYSESLKTFTIENELKNIIFLHNLPNQELAWLYKNASIHLYLSLKEGFGLPPFEALNYNTVSLLARASCLPEIYGDSMLYADPLSCDDIFKQMQIIKNRKIDIDRLLEKGKVRAKKYTWMKSFRQIENLL